MWQEYYHLGDYIKDMKRMESSPIFIPKKSTKIKNKIRNKRKGKRR